MQDLLDHGEARKKQEEAEFARIDAEAKDERDKEAGLRGKVRLLRIAISWMRVASVLHHRYLTFWMARMLDLPGQNQRPSMALRTG